MKSTRKLDEEYGGRAEHQEKYEKYEARAYGCARHTSPDCRGHMSSV